MYKICIMQKMIKETENNKNKTFTITKKIAKHGNQAIIVVPRILEQQLKPGTIVKLNIDVLDEIGKEGGEQ